MKPLSRVNVFYMTFYFNVESSTQRNISDSLTLDVIFISHYKLHPDNDYNRKLALKQKSINLVSNNYTVLQ